MNKNEKTNIIIQALLPQILSDSWKELNEDELFHICKYVDYNKIPDRVIADSEILQGFICWDNLDKMKIIRIVARNESVLRFVDLSKYKYTIKEIKAMLKIRPHLINEFNINFGAISHDDAFYLLTIGVKEISERVNMRNYDFTAKEIYKIIEHNYFEESIVDNFDLKKLKDYHVCQMIINTGEAYFDRMNLKILTARKWIEILQVRPELLQHCDLNKFIQGDIFNSVELICLFEQEDFDFLIKDRNCQDELSPLGWEKLMISKPEEYADICCYWKLNESNWKNILTIHPYLEKYKTVNYN